MAARLEAALVGPTGYCRGRPLETIGYAAAHRGLRTARDRDRFMAAEIDGNTERIYILGMQFRWDDSKRHRNLTSHGLDFIDAPRVFEGPTFTFEDDRFSYREQRFVTLGFLGDICVSIVHTETPTVIRVISFRKATRNEESILFQNLQN